MEPVKVGLLGMGTVGGGTVNVLRRNAEEIARRAGRGIEVTHAAGRDLNKPRICNTEGITLTTNPQEVVDNPDIQIVVELIGGDTLARELVMRAIANGKHVVTANKALIAKHGNEIFAAAQNKGVMVAFESLRFFSYTPLRKTISWNIYHASFIRDFSRGLVHHSYSSK